VVFCGAAIEGAVDNDGVPVLPEGDNGCLSLTQVQSMTWHLSTVNLLEGDFYYNDVYVDSSSAAYIAMMVVVSVSVLLSLVYAIGIMVYHKTPVVHYSSVVFVAIIFIGGFLQYVGAYLYLQKPTDVVCMMALWFELIGAVGRCFFGVCVCVWVRVVAKPRVLVVCSCSRRCRGRRASDRNLLCVSHSLSVATFDVLLYPAHQPRPWCFSSTCVCVCVCVCVRARALSLSLSLSLVMIAAIVVKNARIWWVIRATKKMTVVRVSNLQLVMCLVAAMVPLVILLILWTAIDLWGATTVLDDRLLDDERYLKCSSDNESVWFGVAYGYIGVWLLAAAIFSWVTRRFPSVFNESTVIALAVYNIIILEIITLPLVLTFEDDEYEARTILFSLAATYRALATLTLIMVPKLLVAVLKPEKNVVPRFGSGSSRPRGTHSTSPSHQSHYKDDIRTEMDDVVTQIFDGADDTSTV
jgi:7 transmembrane sweet-taste receptor of 3 GCPR